MSSPAQDSSSGYASSASPTDSGVTLDFVKLEACLMELIGWSSNSKPSFTKDKPARESHSHGQISVGRRRRVRKTISPVPRGPAVPASESKVKFAVAAKWSNGVNKLDVKHIPAFDLNGESLCRPWGVASDKSGNLIVADRSNNRVLVFGRDGRVLRSFGSKGVEPGEFNLPAGVAVDSEGRILVVDKDNHRVQVFSSEGRFLALFGGSGSAPGLFDYPWDIAVNSEGQIAVSDSKNHRVQLFSPERELLRMYVFAGLPKFRPMPRGIRFNGEGQILVNDFEFHRVFLIEPDMLSARVLVNPDSDPEVMNRPQGLAVDKQGNIYVADSRNHRIAMFDKTGVPKWSFGTFEHGESREDGMDRPAGLALTPEGKIAVVDFGNNRVKVLTRSRNVFCQSESRCL